MQVIKLSAEEKQKIIAFLKEKEDFYKKKISTYTRELKILKDVQTNPPQSVSGQWIEEVASRVTMYEEKVQALQATNESHKNTLIDMDVAKPIVVTEAMKKSLGELYTRERDKKSVDPVYKYYPRLKRAKEAALRVFSNKIKIIMESENVQVA